MDTPKKLMIADDNPGIIDSLSIMLEFAGYAVSTTLQGMTLLEMDAAKLPDLILLDIWMSGIDGRDICKQLKQEDATRHIPIVLISASKDIERSAIEAGANDFLAKPFEMDDLLKKIAILLDK